MLWYKYWLETRSQVLFLTVYALFPIALFTLNPRSPQGSSAAVEGALGFFGGVYYSMIPVLLAGSGVKAQAGPQMAKGLVGSTYFTLSLPVSRLRLVATRAGVGMLEVLGILVIAPFAVWIMFPPLRANVTGSDLLLFWVTLFTCSAVIHSVGVLLSTFLDDPWRGFAGMLSVLLLQRLLSLPVLPRFVNVFQAMGPASPLFTHTLPWASIAVSVASAMALFVVAVKVLERREY